MVADELLQQLISLGGGTPRHSEYTGVKALMLAVLEDGIRSYCSTGRRRLEAEIWVSTRGPSPFSFTVLCETLGLEPDAVRRVLPQLQTRSLRGRLRPNARRHQRITRSRRD